ncbi:2-polyprenyl-6-methoxyphenol hydroxylase-like oxidoreductase [Herbaspirillum sp. CF444]|uniref:FAD-dependent monooxygenase n=1 Tax=Herbaspirillum sp. CF444 TaxID=1144319 RepID=UPI00027257AD|nr:FAD-dependent monooxygenase [Herbaspirillum sp. CF444]EJL89141.1 2-polyprenyl-6-methoxyphenol hydroxylase-like oxidoreductase [Herbaspirillum sp. CF444]
MTMQHHPVLIVGAGPTGLTAAMELSRLGVPVRLIDKLAAPSTTSRALAVQARTLELLQQRGLTDKMLAAGNKASAGSLYGRGKLLGKIDLSRIPGRHNYVLLLSQAETERLLTEQLQQQGVQIERGVELIGFVQAQPSTPDSGVMAELRHADGTVEQMQAAVLISAEGAHSSARHALKLPFEGKSLKPTYALADLYAGGEIASDQLSIFISDHGFLAMFPLAQGHFRMIAIEPDADGQQHEESVRDIPDDPPTLSQLQAIYDAHSPMPATLTNVVWSSHFRINSRMLQTLRQGNVFFGGDAAHIHSPAGGQGMNTGIQDMVDLCWKLALVLQGRADAALLDTYERDRLPVIRNIVTRTEAATDVLNSRNTLVHRLVTHIAPLALSIDVIQDTATRLISEINIDYRGSPLSVTHDAGGSLHGGDRLPDIDVIAWEHNSSDDESREGNLYALLDPSRLTLLIAQGAAAPILPQDWREQLRRWEAVLTIRHIAAALADGQDREFRNLFGSYHLHVARPDCYLGFVGDAAQWDALIAWLEQWFSPSAG